MQTSTALNLIKKEETEKFVCVLVGIEDAQKPVTCTVGAYLKFRIKRRIL